jgi:uncharacterized protein YndB with AHSA1/START domain
MADFEVVEEVEIVTSRAAAWAAIADPEKYSRWSPENVGMRRVGATTGAWAVGDKFVGTNRAWFRWSTACTVVTVEPEQTFAFDVTYLHLPVARWEYSLADGATPESVRVTERWIDHRVGFVGKPTRLAGVFVGRGLDAASHNRQTMQTTLQALKRELESG